MKNNMSIKGNLEKVIEEIEYAKKHSLTGQDVKLIAVSKNHPVEKINELAECGCIDFGENRVQELLEKIPLSKSNINYHMIGNLQTNKVKYIYNKVTLIQSVDKIKLAKEINKRAKNDNIFVDILIQVNISREDQKGGVNPEDTIKFLEDCLEYKNLRIKGLMGIAANTDDQKLIRDSFRSLFKIKEDITKRNYQNISMDYLSMGMSGDFKIAIEEGSNMVRIGSRIFGKREY